MASSRSWRRSGGRALHRSRGRHAGRSPCGLGGWNERLDHQCHHARAEGAAARDRQRDRGGRDGHEQDQRRGPGEAVSREDRRRQLVHGRVSRALRDASRIPSGSSGLPPSHAHRRGQDRESDGAHGARREARMNTRSRTVGRPEPDEIPSNYVGYVKRVPELDPVTVCAAQIEDTATLLRGVSETDAMYRYGQGKWSIKEVVGHLADVERIMAYRALRIGRGDTTPLPGFDENAYVPVARFDTRSLADLVGELRTVRAGTLALLRTFDADAWRRRGTANGTPVSVRAIAFMIPGHERHHVEVLRTRYGVGGGAQG